jgi:hypothetical protein
MVSRLQAGAYLWLAASCTHLRESERGEWVQAGQWVVSWYRRTRGAFVAKMGIEMRGSLAESDVEMMFVCRIRLQ